MSEYSRPAQSPLRPIRLVYRGQTQELSDTSPTLSVLEWLRTQMRQTGTKEGCAEGDCGACTVIVAELAEEPSAAGTGAGHGRDHTAIRVGPLLLRPINACIRFMPTMDGKALLTVEDLTQGSSLHPAQQALVECHGSQCGFCTPGFAMSMVACFEQHREAGTRPSRQQAADALAGNLCRCTGYRPILDAAQRMFELPGPRLQLQGIAEQLAGLRQELPLHYEGPSADGSGSRQRFLAPRSLDELAQARQNQPGARLLAGSTDVGLWVNKQFRPLGDILYLGDVAELREIRTLPDGSLHLGAGASLEDAWSALVARWPALQELWVRFAGPPVRHAGTLGGNIANGSPIGDGAPALMAMDARLLLRRGDDTREIALQDFYMGYMKNALESGEWLQAIIVPPQPAARQWRAWKISKRFDCDISALCGVFALELNGQTIEDVRVVFGGMAATVQRAQRTEALLRGQLWTESTLAAAQQVLSDDYTPLTDLRASANYRIEAARGLLRRWWLQTRPMQPLPVSSTTVWMQRVAEGTITEAQP